MDDCPLRETQLFVWLKVLKYWFLGHLPIDHHFRQSIFDQLSLDGFRNVCCIGHVMGQNHKLVSIPCKPPNALCEALRSHEIAESWKEKVKAVGLCLKKSKILPKINNISNSSMGKFSNGKFIRCRIRGLHVDFWEKMQLCPFTLKWIFIRVFFVSGTPI